MPEPNTLLSDRNSPCWVKEGVLGIGCSIVVVARIVRILLLTSLSLSIVVVEGGLNPTWAIKVGQVERVIFISNQLGCVFGVLAGWVDLFPIWGVSGVAPNVAEYWLEATEQIMDDLDYTGEKKLKGAVSLLYVDAQRKEFLSLTQGNKTVVAYEAEFLRLSRYARGIVATEYECCVRFEDGLRNELRVLIAPQRERNFAALVEKAKITEDVKRSKCQNREKYRVRFRRDFGSLSSLGRLAKRARFDGLVRAEVPTATARPGRGQARGGNGSGRGRGTLGRGPSNTEARQTAFIYAAHHREDSDAPYIITGMFLIYNVPYTAVIDIGSTHSYVACTVSETLGIQSESTASEMTVLSQLGQSVRVNKLFRDVPLEVLGGLSSKLDGTVV
ncbi:uncharacterized protein [Gossypium hirsutum]|uniref:Retrotransposon gag domain-containing protein n=1 Tax=Gossypium hirsutum TaxID=3635 RepID=A0A1U8IKJ6_GOSHI|nr:uncharacterized protein LOC107895641 [Gossypium hirsutum]